MEALVLDGTSSCVALDTLLCRSIQAGRGQPFKKHQKASFLSEPADSPIYTSLISILQVMLQHYMRIEMMTEIVQSRSPDEENDSGTEDLKQTFSHPPRRLQTFVLVFVGILSVISLLANVYFIHRQFIRPWDLADELPSKYGKLGI